MAAANLESNHAMLDVRDGLCKRLAARGVKFDQIPKDMEWAWRHAYLAEPDGHELSLYWAGDKRLKGTH